MTRSVNFETERMHHLSQNKQKKILKREEIRNIFFTFKSQTNVLLRVVHVFHFHVQMSARKQIMRESWILRAKNMILHCGAYMIMIRTVYHKIYSLSLHILKFYLIKILSHLAIDDHSSILKFKDIS